jgi:hypothetical protein
VLSRVVADFGVAGLSSLQAVSGVLDDLWPEAAAEKALLVAAAEAGLAGQLRELLDEGMSPGTAASLAAARFSAAAVAFPAEACVRAADLFAGALGASPVRRAGWPGTPQHPLVQADPVARTQRQADIRLRLPVAGALPAAWDALETIGWRPYADVVLPGGQFRRLTARPELREFAGHLESVRGGTTPRDGGPSVSVEVRAASTPGLRHATLSAVVTVSHLGWKTPEDDILASAAIHDLTDRLTPRRRSVRWRKNRRPSPPPSG